MKSGVNWWVACCVLAMGCGKEEAKPPAKSGSPVAKKSGDPPPEAKPNPPLPPDTNATVPVAPLPAIVSPLPLEEQARREMRASYYYNDVDPARVLGEDVTGDGQQDVGRMAFDTEVRHRLLRHVQSLGIGFSQTTVTGKMQGLFVNTNGVHQPALQQKFEAGLQDHNLTAADWRRTVHNDLAIRHLNRVQGLAGGFLPVRVSRQYYALDREEFEADLVVFAATNFTRQVPDTPAALSAFYLKNAQRYRQPDRLKIVHVPLRFAVLDPGSKPPGPELKKAVDEYYEKNAGTISLPTKLAKQQIRQQMLLRRHPKTAARFQALIRQLAKKKPVNLARLREVVDATPGLSLLQQELVPGANVPRQLLEVVQAAGQLGPGQLLSQPAVADDALHLVGLVMRVPQPFKKFNELSAEQHSTVGREYREETSLELALNNGRAFAPLLGQRVQGGEAFEAVCQSAKVWVVPLPRFTLGQADWGTNAPPVPLTVGIVQGTVLPMLDGGETSRLSGFVHVHGGGFILRLKKRHGLASAPPKEVRKFVGEMRLWSLAAGSLDSLYPVPVNRQLASLPPGWSVAEWRNLRRGLMLQSRGARMGAVGGDITKAEQRVVQLQAVLQQLTAQKKDTTETTKQLNQSLQALYGLKQEAQFYQAEKQLLARGPRAVGVLAPPPSDAERVANDALFTALSSTNVTPAAVLKMAGQHPGTAAAHRAQWVAACNSFHQENADLQAVMGQLDQLLKAKPNSPLVPGALLGRAVCHDDLGQRAQARADYQALIARHPHHLAAVPARLALGILAREAGDHPGAHAQFQAVIATDPIGYWARFAGLFKRRLPPLKPPR